MNKTKKLLTLLLASSLVTTACSTGSNQDTSKNQSATQTTSATPTNEEVLKKFYENFSSMKSLDVKTEFTASKIENGAAAETMKISGEESIVKNPLAKKTTYTLDVESQKLKLATYIKDSVIYLNVPDLIGPIWVKTTDQEMISQFTATTSLAYNEEYINLFKEKSDKVTISEKDNKYEITYQGTGDEVKSIIDKLTNSINQANQDPEVANFTVKNAKVTFLVNKESLQAESLNIDITTLDPSGETPNQEVNIKSTINFSNINQVAEIQLADGADKAINAEALAQLEALGN